MSVLLSPIGNAAQFFTFNGTPLNAGTLTTYAAGTSTPQATYTSAAGDVANGNPIILGVDGRTPQEIWLTTGVAYKFVLADSLGNVLGTYDNISGMASGLLLPQSYFSGLGMSTAGGSGTMTIAAGQVSDSLNSVAITLAAAISKTTAGWTVGNAAGGLDAGSIANSTWYHFYLIMRPDTGVVDVTFSTSATAPALPSGYQYYRRIGSMKTNGAAQWTSFLQVGDIFSWLAPVNDVTANNPGSAAVTRTLTVPTGLNVLANIEVSVSTPTFTLGGAVPFNVPLYLSDLAITDTAPAVGTACDTYAGGNGTVLLCGLGVAIKSVRTNTTAQIRSRLGASDATVNVNLLTLGWTDRRGRDG